MVRKMLELKSLILVAASCLVLTFGPAPYSSLVAATTANTNYECHSKSNTFKVDCHPDPGGNEPECTSRGCCWLESSDIQQPPYAGQPSCFFPPEFNCYHIRQIDEEQQQPKHHQHEDYPLDGGRESSDDNGQNLGGETIKSQEGRTAVRWLLIRKPDCFKSGFSDDAREIEVRVSVHGDSIINIEISEPDRKRFEPSLPEIKLPPPLSSLYSRNSKSPANVPVGDYHDDARGEKIGIGQLVVQIINEPSASASSSASSVLEGSVSVLKVIHQPSGAILFETDFGKLIYSRQFIQLPTYLASPFVYGLGQHLGESLLKSSDGKYAKSYTMFNYGHPPLLDGRTAYSSYPFYMNLAQLRSLNEQPKPDPAKMNISEEEKEEESFEMRPKMMATGGLMLNSNAMDVLLHSKLGEHDHRAGITWRLVGGIVDLYLFVGPNPHDVIEQYQSLVGRPQLPPAWSLGYHQSRLNYRDLLQIKLAWARTRSAGIPMESIWTDLEFMWRTTSYTLNNNELNDLVKIIQKEFDMHYVPIVDPAISISEDLASYEALKLAAGMDLFAAYPAPGGIGDSSTAVVTTWTDSKQSGILDFTNPKIVNYLIQVLKEYQAKLNFDGVWLDMNEPEVFANEPNEAGEICADDSRLQYLPGNRPLSDRTLCMAAEFWAGKHYDLHNLYAFYQAKAHFEALKILNDTKRPFIISRSQFVGQGKYSGSWLGDMGSVFYHLSWSLMGTIESNWFGQPLIGADICGFFGSTTDELCARWFSLGAFYPLSRNHNEGSSRDQDPGSLDETVQRAARVALVRRYSLLPYLYSLFYENHLHGQPVVRSVMFEFFEQFHLNSELTELPQINDQLMWGPAFMVAPILESNRDFRTVYLAPGRWYDVSIGLPGTNMEEDIYDTLTSNWPLYDSSHEGLDEPALTRLAGLRKSIDCHERLGCILENQYTPVGAINVYLRGGHIVPTFRNVNHLKSVNQLWSKASFFLEIGLDFNDEAFGSLYWDSGESDPEARLYNRAHFWLSHNRLIVATIESRFEDPLRFDGFIVYGVKLCDDQIPEPVLYRDSKLLYTHDSVTETLRCQFLSPDMEKTRPLTVARFDKLVFKW